MYDFVIVVKSCEKDIHWMYYDEKIKYKHNDFFQFQNAMEHCNSMPYITIGLHNPLLQLNMQHFNLMVTYSINDAH